MLRSEQLEREAEARRLELAETFDELRARATPGHVLDQIVDYATESGGRDFFRNLRDQSVANPLALGLMGAGLAWLMMNGRESRRGYDPYEVRPSRPRMRSYLSGTRERAGHAVSEARHFMSDAAAGVRDRVSGAAHMASHMASDAAHMASDAAGSIAHTTASTARGARDATYGAVSSVGGETRHRMGDTSAALGGAASALYGGVAHSAERTASGMRAFASGAASTAASTGRDAYDFALDQPLVLAGLGLAFGAAMGAAFPSTETERQLMGEASDELKERTQALAAENYERSKSMAEAVFGDVQHRMQEEVRRGGPSSSSVMSRHSSLVPLDEEITQELRETTIRPERIGLRDRG